MSLVTAQVSISSCVSVFGEVIDGGPIVVTVYNNVRSFVWTRSYEKVHKYTYFILHKSVKCIATTFIANHLNCAKLYNTFSKITEFKMLGISCLLSENLWTAEFPHHNQSVRHY